MIRDAATMNTPFASAESDTPQNGSGPLPGRFRPGQSGNLKGRPRKIHQEQSAIESALGEAVTITDSKGKRKVPAATVIAKRLVQKGMTGDIAAIKMLEVYSPGFLKRVLETSAKFDQESFYSHLLDHMGLDAFRLFRHAMASWGETQRAKRAGDRMVSYSKI